MNRRYSHKLASAITNRKNRPLIFGLLFTLSAAVTALACGWSYVTDHSVRFNSYRKVRGFYRLPPLPLMYDPKTGKELSTREVEDYDSEEGTVYEADNVASPPPTGEEDIWEQARAAADEKRLNNLRKLLKEYLVLTVAPSVEGGSSLQANRNTAYDILDAMLALKAGSTEDAVTQYINARYSYQSRDQNLNLMIGQAAADKNLSDNWDYLQAAALYSEQRHDEAFEAFRAHAVKYPRSEKNEAVMYMISKLYLESLDEKDHSNVDADESETKLEEASEDKNKKWNAAFAAFQELMKRYPNGRYFNDARRWLGFLYKKNGDTAHAMAVYYSLLGHPTDRSVRLKAKFDLQYLGHDQTDATLDEVENLIANDPETALAYAYHRIYNHAVDLSYTEFQSWCCDGDNRWQQVQDENKRVSDLRNAGNDELERIARFATVMMKRHPHSRVSGGFVLRVAETQLELQNYQEALALAQKAMTLGLTGEKRAEALWVKGSSYHKQMDLKAARSTFLRLIAEFPKGRLTEGARRLLALTAEDEGDLETALEQYLALNYEYDVAYYVDVLLPTERLASFVNARKDHPQHDYLLYALGVRYMRDKRWDDARATLRQVRTETVPPIESNYYGKNREVIFAKEPDWDERTVLKTSWVMQDLKSIDALEHLEKAVETAPDDEAKAEAMYQLASYQFEADDLLFYNPAAWKGMRHWLLDDLADSGRTRFANEEQTIFEHSQQHEGLSRAIPIYLEIAERFPNTRAAKDALYSAAVAQQRVSNLNPYWRDIYSKGLFAGPREIGLSEVRSTYPNYQLPRGTDGWEPSSRTVNGGPGWAPEPKPAPPLTQTQKFERRLKYISETFRLSVKPRIDSVTTWTGSAVDGYISIINSVLSWLLALICLMLTGYFALVAVYFREPLLAAITRFRRPEVGFEQQSLSESRIEKLIDDGRL